MDHKKINHTVLDFRRICDYIEAELSSRYIKISRKDIEATLLTFLNQFNKHLFNKDTARVEIVNFGSFRTKKRTRTYKSLKAIKALFKTDDPTPIIQTVFKTHFTLNIPFKNFLYSLIDRKKTLVFDNLKNEEEMLEKNANKKMTVSKLNIRKGITDNYEK